MSDHSEDTPEVVPPIAETVTNPLAGTAAAAAAAPGLRTNMLDSSPVGRSNCVVPGNCSIHAVRALDKAAYKSLFAGDTTSKTEDRKEMKNDILWIAGLCVVFRPLLPTVLSRASDKWKARQPAVWEQWAKEYMCDTQPRKQFWTHTTADAGDPEHNNHLEGLNKVFKNECTLYQKQPVAFFVQKQLLPWFRQKSFLQAQFYRSVVISEKDWHLAQAVNSTEQFGQTMEITIPVQLTCTLKMITTSAVILIVSNKALVNIHKKHADDDKKRQSILKILQFGQRALEGKFEADDFPMTHDSLKFKLGGFHVLYPNAETGPETQLMIRCSCIGFQRRRVCEHALAYSIRHGLRIPLKKDLGHLGVNLGGGGKNARRGGAYTERPPGQVEEPPLALNQMFFINEK